MSRVRVLTSTISAALLLLTYAHSGVAALAPGIALVPSQWAVEPKRTLAEVLGIDRDAIYLFRADQDRPTKVFAAGNTLVEWVEVAPDLQTIAYGFTYPDPAKIDVVLEHRISGVGILDATGVDRLRIIGGRAAAWSPSGRRLAVLVPRRTAVRRDTMRIWDRLSGGLATFSVAVSEGFAWRSDDTLVVGADLLVASTGKVLPSGHAGYLISPDRRYSMAGYSEGPGIWSDTSKVDITESVIQVCGATRLKSVGRTAWISGRGEGHLVALGVMEDTTGHHEKEPEVNSTSIIDVSIPELLETIPGRLVSVASDGRTLVVLRHDGIHFVPPRSGNRISRSNMAYGSGVAPHPAKAWIEMTAIGWSHNIVLDHADTLEVRTFSVAPGDRIGVEPSRYNFERKGSSTFRAIAIRSNGSVLMECKPGLVPAGQRFGKGSGYRFIVTNGPVEIGTASYDAGEFYRLRVVPESLARERLRNGTARRRGQSVTTMMGKPYTPKPDTTFDQPPRPLAQAPAWLPKPWRKGQFERLVYVTAVVDTNGRVSDPKLALQNPPDIEAAIQQAARRFTFEPARKRGRPVPTGWGFNVELKHPRSRELGAPEDTSSTVWAAGRDVGVHIRASAYYDSVDETYRYSYALENRSRGPARVTTFALLGCATGLKDELERPDNWNGFFCGNRPDVMGWMIWEKEPAEGLFGYATKPGAWLAPMKFKSKSPPGKVRWLVQTASERAVYFPIPCDPSPEPPLSGTIVGPAGSVPLAPGGR